jgi:hypothetical protein
VSKLKLVMGPTTKVGAQMACDTWGKRDDMRSLRQQIKLGLRSSSPMARALPTGIRRPNNYGEEIQSAVEYFVQQSHD